MNSFSVGNFTICVDLVGAQLRSINYLGREYLHPGDDIYWGRSAPVLFPNVGRFYDDTYSYNQQLFGLSQHGFLRDQEFKLVSSSSNQLSFEFCSNEYTRKLYPFDFKFVVSYLFDNDSVITSYEVINLSSGMMYYNVGAHPAFKIDLDKDYVLELDGVDKMLEMCPPYISRVVDNDQSIYKVESDLFKEDALIFETSNHKSVMLSENGVNLLQVSYSDAMFVGLWQPDLSGCPFVCIEPWWGVADYSGRVDNELVNKPHILQLDVGMSKVHSYKIKFFRGV